MTRGDNAQQRGSSPTTYGTTNLATNDQGATAMERRRNMIRWGFTALTVGAGLALIGYGYSHHSSGASVGATTGEAVPGSPASAEVGVGAIPTGIVGGSIQCWQSSYVNGETKMMEPISGLTWSKSSSPSPSPSSVISVDGSKKFQEIFGFGGAFTEAAGLQFQKLPLDKQEQVLKLYFDKQDGSGYEFGRVPMGSCDFSTSSYNYDNVTDDMELLHFDDAVQEDTKVIIPFIKRALEKNPALKLFLAPWSPPAWMKRADTNYVPSMLGSATPNGLATDFRKPWANYFSRFISAYKNYGINFWGLTPQNEPEFAAPWEACGYNASFQADFVGDFLGPVMKRDHPEVKIMVFDHNRASVLKWAETVFTHPTANKFVDGIAIHWYDDARIMDGVEFHERVNDTHYVDETKFILATESCNCPGVETGQNAWFRGQRYAHDIMTDLNNWVVGWVDWNLILDFQGGPNHLGNNCDAPIILTKDEKDFFIQPMYYFIQHFSKFVVAGSKRILTTVNVKFDQPGDAQLFVDYPAALHSCDQSARQQIHVTEDNKLQVTGTEYCIDLVRPEWIGRQVKLVKCIYTSQKWTFNAKTKQIHMDDHCLQLHGGSILNSARVTNGQCIDFETEGVATYQQWGFKNGIMYSLAASGEEEEKEEKCVTAGYAFVQSASFITPQNQKVTVVLNENTQDAHFELQYGDATLKTLVPAGAIRTFTWE